MPHQSSDNPHPDLSCDLFEELLNHWTKLFNYIKVHFADNIYVLLHVQSMYNFEWKTFTCNGVFLHGCIDTFTEYHVCLKFFCADTFQGCSYTAVPELTFLSVSPQPLMLWHLASFTDPLIEPSSSCVFYVLQWALISCTDGSQELQTVICKPDCLPLFSGSLLFLGPG